MGGVYLHIPFCRQACHYCDFHFSTSLKYRDRMVDTIGRELELRQAELSGEVATIYFGGGTPSLLLPEQIAYFLNEIHKHFSVVSRPEITLEANPDDMNGELLRAWKKAGINRLSIGVQSFFEEDLIWMNRAHNAAQAESSVKEAMEVFDNISVDLIYGLPEQKEGRWEQNLDKALGMQVPHLSCYALTVEPGTALNHFIETKQSKPVDEEQAWKDYNLLLDKTEKEGYINYEFSNFGRLGYFCENNQAYWSGKPYLGVGPSAHSFDGLTRSWNVSHNLHYMKGIEAGDLPLDRETLTLANRFNEYVMTRLRTASGISLSEVSSRFGPKYVDYLLDQARGHLTQHLLFRDEDKLMVSRKGKFLTDGISSDLFLLPLSGN